MSTALATVSLEDIPSILDQLDAAFYDIPFENSDYQNQAFVVAAQQTPARAYRAVGLRMFSKIRAVKEYLFQQEKNQIDRDEKEWKLTQPDTNEFEKRRLRLEIAQLDDGAQWGKKLLNDALRELECLNRDFQRLPKYTREQFEAEEVMHFQQRLQRQLSAGGAMESILNMTEDLPQFEQRIEKALIRMEEGPRLAAPAPAVVAATTPGLPPTISTHRATRNAKKAASV